MTIMPSGRIVGRSNDEVPTYHDIAHNLCRQIRFGGSSDRPWSVMQHTFVVAAHVPAHMRAFALLHDACEAITGDTPRPVKHAEQSMIENDLTARISRDFGLPWPWPADVTEEVHRVDMMVACAEALILFGEGARNWCQPWDEPTPAMIRDVISMLPMIETWFWNAVPAAEQFRSHLMVGLEAWKAYTAA